MATYADDIRRIAKQDKLKGALDSAPERDPIPSMTTAFESGSFAPSSGSSASGDDSDSGGDTESTEDDAVTFDPTDPTTFNRGGGDTTTSGSYDIEDVVDGTDGPQTPPDNTDTVNTDEASVDWGGGSMTGLTGMTDCDTGDCINIRTDGTFTPPADWDDPDTPPVAAGYEAGYYWSNSGNSNLSNTTPQRAMDDDIAWWSAANAGKATWFDSWVYQNETTASYKAWIEIPPATIFQFFLVRGSCGAEVGTVRCPLSPPVEDEWPDDGCYDLSLIDGTFQTNQYDPNAPIDAGGSMVSVCFGSARTADVYATASGGVMIAETTAGATNKVAKVWAKDGTFQAAGDVTQQFMDQWLPK